MSNLIQKKGIKVQTILIKYYLQPIEKHSVRLFPCTNLQKYHDF